MPYAIGAYRRDAHLAFIDLDHALEGSARPTGVC